MTAILTIVPCISRLHRHSHSSPAAERQFFLSSHGFTSPAQITWGVCAERRKLRRASSLLGDPHTGLTSPATSPNTSSSSPLRLAMRETRLTTSG